MFPLLTGSFREDDELAKLIHIAGGLSPEADTTKAILFRVVDGESKKIEIDLSEVDNIYRLQPNDRIIIPFDDSKIRFGTVSIFGEVSLPGTYNINTETTLSELLELAGGLSENALSSASYLIRESFDNRGVSSVSSINMPSLTRSSDQFLEGFDYMELEQALLPNKMALDLSNPSILERTKLEDGDKVYIPRG